MAFSGSKMIIQPLSHSLHATSRSDNPLLSDPFSKAAKPITTSSPFLGSTRTLRLNQSVATAQRQAASRIVAVSDVFKEKKLKSKTNLVRSLFLLH